MSPDSSSPILRRLDPRGVATLTFNRPEVNNACDGELLTATLLAMDALAGERFDAHEARRIGLVHGVVPLAGLEAAFEFARGKMTEETLAHLVARHAARRRSEEAAEGLASFAEKRPARWYS